MSRNKSNQEMMEYDVDMALKLHQRYNPIGLTENAVFPKEKKIETYTPRTLIDQTLEIVDPTPNIYTLFTQFNTRFFSGKLLSVEVKWSKRMTSCAGVCTFHSRNRDCVISLSAPLLKLRPRKDLVETLLHEMIHGYLFLTNNNRDRDGHGPEFQKIMHRINKEAGTEISIYHNFHEEVRVYQQHWWRCDGPCTKRPPYFGTVRRAMNRQPGPSDSWWLQHQQTCNGKFIKIREPEKKQPIKKQTASKVRPIVGAKKSINGQNTSSKVDKNLDDWFGRTVGMSSTSVTTNFTATSNDYQTKIVAKPSSSIGGLVKLGTSTNNVHGWGTAGPSSSSKISRTNSSNTASNVNKSPRKLNFAGTLGGFGNGKSNLLDKYTTPIQNNRVSNHVTFKFPTNDETITAKKRKIEEKSIEIESTYNCPICNLPIKSDLLNEHLDVCLIVETTQSKSKTSETLIEIFDSPVKQQVDPKLPKLNVTSSTATKLENFVVSPDNNKSDIVSCPACDRVLHIKELYAHLDKCTFDFSSTSRSSNTNKTERVKTKSHVVTKNVEKPLETSYTCLVCKIKVSSDIDLADHLEDCVQAIFNDDSFDVGNESIEEISSPIINETVAKNLFPCPICTLPIRENLMNEHLDKCLLHMNYD